MDNDYPITAEPATPEYVLEVLRDMPDEEFLRRQVEQLLDRPDEQFRKSAAFVLQKNAELYRRSA